MKVTACRRLQSAHERQDFSEGRAVGDAFVMLSYFTPIQQGAVIASGILGDPYCFRLSSKDRVHGEVPCLIKLQGGKKEQITSF